MNDLVKEGDKRMTVREVAEALGYDPRTIQLKVKELFPDIVVERQTTFLNEVQVTAVKRACEKNFAATTDLEMMLLDRRVSEWKTQKIEELQQELQVKESELAAAVPKIESFDALMKSERCMSITDAAKHFGLHPKTEVFPYLRALKYLTQNDLPSQSAIDSGYLALKEVKDQAGNIWPQAVVETWQLENWRAHVVPQIKRWNGEERSA